MVTCFLVQKLCYKIFKSNKCYTYLKTRQNYLSFGTWHDNIPLFHLPKTCIQKLCFFFFSFEQQCVLIFSFNFFCLWLLFFKMKNLCLIFFKTQSVIHIWKVDKIIFLLSLILAWYNNFHFFEFIRPNGYYEPLCGTEKISKENEQKINQTP